MHVNPMSPTASEAVMYTSQEVLEENILKESKVRLRKTLKKVERLPFNTKHTFSTLAFYDYFTERVKREVKEKKIDLIVMGTKGATGLKAVTVGSNTGNVITKVKCAVLTVPENARYKIPREIAFPTDYNLNYDLKVLNGIKELAIMNKSTIRFLYISQVGEELTRDQIKNKTFLENYFQDVDHTFHKVTGEKLENAVQCFTESRDIDLIAMVAKNLNFLQRILFRPRVEKISYHIQIPFLVLHE